MVLAVGNKPAKRNQIETIYQNHETNCVPWFYSEQSKFQLKGINEEVSDIAVREILTSEFTSNCKKLPF